MAQTKLPVGTTLAGKLGIGLLLLALAGVPVLILRTPTTDTKPQREPMLTALDQAGKTAGGSESAEAIVLNSATMEMTPLQKESAQSRLSLAASNSIVRFHDLPENLSSLWRDAYVEIAYGNFDQAAFTALEAIELANGYPYVQVDLHYLIGLSYENLGYIDMAVDAYLKALAIKPKHRLAHTALRRVSAEFAAANEELPPGRNRAADSTAPTVAP